MALNCLTNRSTGRIAATSLAFFLSASAVAANPPPKMTGTFSSLAYIEEAGDLLGTEISILYGAGDYYALVQCSEGSPGVPFVVKVLVDGSEVTFTVPKGSGSGCPEATYIGIVSKAGLKGQFSGYGQPELLMRKKSYWQ